MATISFSMPTAPPVIFQGRKASGVFEMIFSLLILVGLGVFIWWFYKNMKKNEPLKK